MEPLTCVSCEALVSSGRHNTWCLINPPDNPTAPDEAERACTCSPPPNVEGPAADCDVHGQPSVAFSQGYDAGKYDASVLDGLNMRDVALACGLDRNAVMVEILTWIERLRATCGELRADLAIEHQTVAGLRAEVNKYRRSASDAAVELGVALETLRAAHKLTDAMLEQRPTGGQVLGLRGVLASALSFDESMDVIEQRYGDTIRSAAFDDEPVPAAPGVDQTEEPNLAAAMEQTIPDRNEALNTVAAMLGKLYGWLMFSTRFVAAHEALAVVERRLGLPVGKDPVPSSTNGRPWLTESPAPGQGDVPRHVWWSRGMNAFFAHGYTGEVFVYDVDDSTDMPTDVVALVPDLDVTDALRRLADAVEADWICPTPSVREGVARARRVLGERP